MSSKSAAAPLGRLQREYVLSPITALAFFASATTRRRRRYALAGEDTDVKIYDVATARLLARVRVFSAQSIHGIVVPPHAAVGGDGAAPGSEHAPRILVWGGQSVRVLSGEFIEGVIAESGRIGGEDGKMEEEEEEACAAHGTAETKAPDWILDGRISPFEEGRVVLLTAHNEVIQARTSADGETLVFGGMQSPSRPILYSGNFFWVARDVVLVAAGTVFGEILVWKCHLGAEEEKGGRVPKCEVLFLFSGHEGSVFGVNISPEVVLESGERLRLLASCSDDRTIRVWDITERREENGETREGYESRISDARETGYGDNYETKAHVDSTTRCVATAMGHVSRIWQVEFPQHRSAFSAHGIVEIYSFGEDATAQKWRLNLSPQNSLPTTRKDGTSRSVVPSVAELTHQSTFSNHSGKHIWSHSMTSGSDDNVLIATGGSDGRVTLIGGGVLPREPVDGNAQSLEGSRETPQIFELTLEDVVQSCRSTAVADESTATTTTTTSLNKSKNTKESFQRYTFVTDSRLLATTNTGRVFLGDLRDELAWTEISVADDTRQAICSYSILESSKAHAIAFIGTTKGEVFCYQDAEDVSLRLLTKLHGKVAAIFPLANSPPEGGQEPITTGNGTVLNSGRVQILVAVLGSTEAEILQFSSGTSPIRRIGVALETGFIVTAAAFCQEHLVLGSRKGMVSILSRNTDGSYSTTLRVEVKRKDAVTSILSIPPRTKESPEYFLATCRDGKYRIYEIKNTSPNMGGQVKVVLLHETSPPFGPMIEGAWLSDDNADGTRDLMLCGFRSTHLVLWNETRRQEVAAVECGGAHRTFAYTALGGNPEGFRFVFTKASQMHIFSQTRAPHRTLKPGGHGREIRAVSASGRYVATAAEDTVIRIWEYHHHGTDPLGRDLRCVAALQRHITGIQTLKWYRNEYLFSSGGYEELFVWKINRLDSDCYSPIAVVCEAAFPDRTEDGDLRIMEFDVECTNDHHHPGDDDDEEEEEEEEENADGQSRREFCISMAFSNSTVQCYTYSARAGFRLLGKRSYTGACLTQLRHLGFAGNGRPQVLTAATDGHLAIFRDILPRSTVEVGRGEAAAALMSAEEEGEEEAATTTVTKLHQSTVKALDMRKADTGAGGAEYLVVTGGDDNALGVLHISSSSSSPPPSNTDTTTYHIRSKSIIRSAHTAAMTGVAIARLENEGRDAVVVTSSNDQRVKVWRVVGWRTGGSGGMSVQLLDDRYSGVADAGDIEMLDGGRRVVVGGVGVEVWGMRLG